VVIWILDLEDILELPCFVFYLCFIVYFYWSNIV